MESRASFRMDSVSYANNSQPQNSMILYARSKVVSIIQKLNLSPDCSIFRIADMGCGPGPNCLINMKFIIETLMCHFGSNRLPEIQSFCCDLPSNDFNQLIQQWNSNYRGNATSFFSAVPGSVYGRLVPKSTLNFVFSSFCIHWLSQVPPTVSDPTSPAYNKGRFWLLGSNEATGLAYAQQWKQDMAEFFRCRSEEMVPNAMMLLICLGRPEECPPHNQIKENNCFINLQIAWQQLIQEEKIDEHTIDSFNLPVYFFYEQEIRDVIDQCPLLRIESLEYANESQGSEYWHQSSNDPNVFARKQQDFYRSAFGNAISEHVGKQKCEIIFERFGELVKKELESQTSWNGKWAMAAEIIILVVSKKLV